MRNVRDGRLVGEEGEERVEESQRKLETECERQKEIKEGTWSIRLRGGGGLKSYRENEEQRKRDRRQRERKSHLRVSG